MASIGETKILPSPMEPVLAAERIAATTPSAWADDTVRRAVELVRAYHPRRLEKTPAGWRLTGADGKTLTVGG